MINRRIVRAASVVIAVLVGASAWPHAFDFTEIDVTFDRGGTFTARVPYHIDALLTGVPMGEPTDEDIARYRALPEAERARRLDEVREYLRTSVRLKFDGEAIEPAIAFPEMEDAANAPMPGQVFELRANVPEEADEFTLTASPIYKLTFLRIYEEGTERAIREEPINPGDLSLPYTLREPVQPVTFGQAIRQYTQLGFLHILPAGLDHVLFVLGLFLLSCRLRPLLWQVTAFTLAHTVTLGAASLGWVNLPAEIVEPLIALSIAYVAIENCLTTELKPWRPIVVFAFGLLHGLGFAGVLGELGLPEGQFAPALIAFNVGVEFGQLTVLAGAFAAVGWFRNRSWYRTRIAMPGSVAIALIAIYWTFERVLG